MPLPLVMHILFIVTFHSPLLTALSRHEATPGGSGPASRPPLHLTRVLGDPRGPPGPSAGTLGRAMRHPGRFPEGGSRSFPLQRGRTFSSCPSLPQPRGGRGDAVPTPLTAPPLPAPFTSAPGAVPGPPAAPAVAPAPPRLWRLRPAGPGSLPPPGAVGPGGTGPGLPLSLVLLRVPPRPLRGEGEWAALRGQR